MDLCWLLLTVLTVTAFGHSSHMRNIMSPNAYAEHAAGMSRSTAAEGSPQDCTMRRLALEYSNHLQPIDSPHVAVYDALQLSALCGDQRPIEAQHRSLPLPSPATGAIHVAPDGNDQNDGTLNALLATVHEALSRVRGSYGPPDPTIVLREGTHLLTQTLTLTPADSGLTIQSHPGELDVLSGGRPLPTNVEWKKLNNQTGNIWLTVLPEAFGEVEALHALQSNHSTWADVANDTCQAPEQEPG